MIVYKDKVFCRFYDSCDKGKSCECALTRKVEIRANLLNLPIERFIQTPNCFERKVK
jgi:hypothetical protein